MVVMFVDCCVGVYSTFCTIPTVESYGAGVPARTLIAVKLLTTFMHDIKSMTEKMHLLCWPF